MTTRKCLHIMLSTTMLLVCAQAQSTDAVVRSKPATPAASDILPDEDGGQVRVIPMQQPVGGAHAQLALQRPAEIPAPQQQSLFFGSNWADASNRARESTLAELLQHARSEDHDALRSKRISTPSQPGQIQHDFTDLGSNATVSDLQIQARIAKWISTGVLAKPNKNTIYIIYLAPGVTSTLRSKVGGKDFQSYYNLIHLDTGDIRYAVVPFIADQEKHRT